LTNEQQVLSVPDRFEQLREVGTGSLRSVVYPVEESLVEISDRFADMSAAGRGGLLVMRGDPGAGKSTFLETIGLFRRGVVTERIPGDTDVAVELSVLAESVEPRVVVVEGREALKDVGTDVLEASLHAINTFVRSPRGENTLVAWPANSDDLTEVLAGLGQQLGGEALLGLDGGVMHFTGPPPGAFVTIAERTVSALNDGASLSALGISEQRAEDLAGQARNIGHHLALVRRDLVRNGARVRSLMSAEQVKLWVLVAGGNEPEGDVAALTRGGLAYADVERLISSTGANIVEELKKEPDTLGILGTVLDARIIHLDMLTALAVAREHGDKTLHGLMKTEGMALRSDGSALRRIAASELGTLLGGDALGTRKRGPKPGPNTVAAFEGLVNVARTNDAAVNRSLGAALVEAGLAESFKDEVDLPGRIAVRSDLRLDRRDGPVRVEVMWRSKVGRADISNYVLGKLGTYARNIGLMGS
jgi:hypothetical protein